MFGIITFISRVLLISEQWGGTLRAMVCHSSNGKRAENDVINRSHDSDIMTIRCR